MLEPLLLDYAFFSLKALTLGLLILLVVAGLAAILFRSRKRPEGTLHLRPLNEKLFEYQRSLTLGLQGKNEAKRLSREIRAKTKRLKELPVTYLLHFQGDIKASATEALREEITALLTLIRPEDEVLLLLESPGGMVPHYGLAASQLKRITERGNRLIVAVDRIAASGGYLMACQATRILAAPYAILGSIGVIAQIPNFHRLLKEKGVDFEQVTAGKYKRTLTLFGENDEQGREKLKEELEQTHALFKQEVGRARPQADLEQVTTGEYWLGTKAKELGLIDEICCSDDYLGQIAHERRLIEVRYQGPKGLKERLKAAESRALGWLGLP